MSLCLDDVGAEIGRRAAASFPSLFLVAFDPKSLNLRAQAHRANAGLRMRNVAPHGTLIGVWLVVVVAVGPGAASSIDTFDSAARRLHGSGFDRAFILDYFGGPKVIELPPSGAVQP